MLLRLFGVFLVISAVSAVDPKDISKVLESHLAAHVPHIPTEVSLGQVQFRNVRMENAFLGDLKTIRLSGKAWFWRKFVWFAVFGDVKLNDMYLKARNFTIDGKNHTGKINIQDNELHFHWEAVDHFKCTILQERIDWKPLRNFELEEGKSKGELIFSEDDVLILKKQLMNAAFLNQVRKVLLPCLHPKYPVSYGWERDDDFDK